jgi:hypothetical protein
MRRLLKFLHTMGAIGMMGAMAAMLVILSFTPAPAGSVNHYALMRITLGGVAEWLLLPSMTLVLLSGIGSMAITPAFHGAGWVMLKLVSGLLIFKGILLSIQGSAQKEAALSAGALAGDVDPVLLGGDLGSEWGALWVVMVIATANVVLGVWRPRLSRAPKPKPATVRPDEEPGTPV